MAFYSKKELEEIGFKRFGKNVLISNKCSIYNAKNISIGDNVRIDDFCILSAGDGEILIGSWVHIACYVSLIGKESIILEDYSQVGAKSSIYSSTDDFSGDYLVGPSIPDEYTNVKHGMVILRQFSVLGCNTVVLPHVTIGEGTAIGALSLVYKDLEPWKIYGGTPVKILKERSTGLFKQVKLLNEK